MMPRLRQVAARKFNLSCNKYWDHEMFAEAATYALSTAPPGDLRLSDKIVGTICAHLELIKKPSVKALLDDHELTYSVLKRSHSM